MDRDLILVVEHGSTCLEGNTATSLNQVDGLWKERHAVLGFEM